MPVCLTTSPLRFFGTLDVLSLPELLFLADSLAPRVRMELRYRGGHTGALTLAGGAVVDARYGALRGLWAALAALAQQPVGFAARPVPPGPSVSAWALPALLAQAHALAEPEVAALGQDVGARLAMPRAPGEAPTVLAYDREPATRSSRPWRAPRWAKLRRS